MSYAILKTMKDDARLPVFERVDCIQVCVPSLDEGLKFYRDALDLKLLWRTAKACGLGMQEGITEFVITTEDNLMVDMKVADVEQAAKVITRAGGIIEEGPFDIDIGKCAVIADPWGNRYCILDTTKGTYDTGADGTVSGVSQK